MSERQRARVAGANARERRKGANVRERGDTLRPFDELRDRKAQGAKEGRERQRAKALALRQAQRPRGVAGGNVRERGVSSCVIVIGSLSTILYTFSGEQPTHYVQPTD